MPNVFERALEVSTPGFDSLLGVIQTETQRIERNRALARQLQQKKDLLKTKNELQKETSKELADYNLKITKELEDFKTEEAKELAQFKAGLEKQPSLFDMSDIKDFNDTANNKSDQIRSRYKNIFSQLAINTPNIQWDIDPTTKSPVFYQAVSNWDKGGDTKIIGEQEYKNHLVLLDELSQFIQDGKDRREEISTSDKLVNVKNDITLIPQEQIDETIEQIRNMPMSKKLGMAEQVANGEVRWFYNDMLPEEPEVKEKKYGADEKDIQQIYNRLFNNRIIRIPEFIRERPDAKEIPETIDLFGQNVNYGDVQLLKHHFDKWLNTGNASLVKNVEGKIEFEDVAVQQTYERIKDYVSLMEKSNRIPNVKVNPGLEMTQDDFGLREINLDEDPLQDIWEDRSGKGPLLGPPNQEKLGDVILQNIITNMYKHY